MSATLVRWDREIADITPASSLILGAALYSTVALWPAGADASAVPDTGFHATVTADPPNPTPYQLSYGRGFEDAVARYCKPA
ncbi:hypothetical protein [Nonomuraea sp. NPDC050786]|uniref:hypothetical protein n=1 Tax=Nonomuraea sp. NPDC050786 TaxID=3154840 RepID=UPI0034068703